MTAISIRHMPVHSLVHIQSHGYRWLWWAWVMVAAFACTGVQADQKFPDVIAVKAIPRTADKFDFDVTVSSPYDTAQRYADAFRVMDKTGKVLGERVLLHDHATEQPFTRDLYGVVIPKNTKLIVVQGRDQKNGWGGKTVELTLPGR